MLPGRRTVLVVEDEPTLQTTLSKYLTLNRFKRLRAESVDDALASLERKHIDVVTLDIGLPDAQGEPS